ncbi:MAG: S49 family peptidase, partial [Acidobacteria bacterium]|nr:S49 family peptidase [Acidobacteriota bacterium]
MSEMTTGGVAPPPPPPGPRRRSGSGCLLTGMLLLAAVLVLGFLGLAAFLFIGEGPTVPEGSILLVGTEGEYPETLQYAPFLFADAGPSFSELVQGLSAAASDPRIAGRTRLGWARARELRDGVLRFREAGKRVTASLEYAGLMDYYLASAADRIHMHPRGQLGLYGVSMEVMFFAGLFEKLGIEAQFEAIGPYKTAPEAFTASGMSPEHRDQLESLGEEFRSGAAEAVAESRGLTQGDADRLLSDGPYTASRALEEGLVDALSYLDEIEEDVGDEELVDIGDYVGSLRRGAPRAAVRVAVIHVDG